MKVTTFAVVWIEIVFPPLLVLKKMSPPSRWCGLKFSMINSLYITYIVTTFAVVWIEISTKVSHEQSIIVTTFAVVWIEIIQPAPWKNRPQSHHLRGGVD